MRRVAMEEPCVVRAIARGSCAAGLAVESALPVDRRSARTGPLAGLHGLRRCSTPAHQFPLGDPRFTPERRARRGAWAAKQRPACSIEDDYDARASLRPHSRSGALQALVPEHVAYGGTASKTLAPGLVSPGWSPRLRSSNRLARLRHLEDLHVPVPDQLAFAELLVNRSVRAPRSPDAGALPRAARPSADDARRASAEGPRTGR